MKFTEHHVKSSLGTVKLQGTGTGHIVAKFGFMSASFNQDEAISLCVALRLILEQIGEDTVQRIASSLERSK